MAMPRAAVVFPLPFPVKTIRSPFSESIVTSRNTQEQKKRAKSPLHKISKYEDHKTLNYSAAGEELDEEVEVSAFFSQVSDLHSEGLAVL
jgi:hypothetical protein